MDIRNTAIAILFVLVLFCAGTAAFLYFQVKNTPDPLPVPQELLKKPEPAQRPAGQELPVRQELKLFFLNQEQDQLTPETRWMETTSVISEKVKSALGALISGPEAKGNVSTIPGGTRLLGVFWDQPDSRMYVNFSEELVNNNPGHSLSEWAAIYSIVNTVAAQSVAVKDVQILVNGESGKDLNTVWDWSLPFTPEKIFVQHPAKGDK